MRAGNLRLTGGGNRRLALEHLVAESGLYLRHISFVRTDLDGCDDMTLLLRAIEGAEVAVNAVESIGKAKLREGS